MVLAALTIPLPERGTESVPSLDATVKLPDSEPWMVGVNVVWMAQLAPGTSDAPQVFVWAKSPEAEMDVICTALMPAVRVIVRARAAIFKSSLPKGRVAGATVARAFT